MRAITNNDTIDTVREELTERLAESDLTSHITLDISQDGDDFVLDRIQSVKRGHGHASRALTVLTQLCDEVGRNIRLTVKPLDQETDGAMLRDWYMKHGFRDVSKTPNVMQRLTSSEH